MRRLAVLAAGVSLVAATLTGCGAHGHQASSITVFAAASLKPAFSEIAEQFRTDNPGVDVEFNFAGSSELATQLIEGADADVFASADTVQMDKVDQVGLLDGPQTDFASNTLVIVTAPDNPKKIGSFADLARPELNVVVCQTPVPCGAATQRVEDAANVHLNPASEEPNVTDVLNKVTTGQADAGVVYVTDALNAGDKVATVKFPEAADAVNVYPIALLRQAPEAAENFVFLVTGEFGEKVLTTYGFAQP
ncbi:molybdate ABC transporter substrate-binding protein [Mycolicibacillus parakoreensis]|uniref:Molybdate ABC transporter substrate-binding protein n=2 Tax=Mycobacteriaceae TaxID=1762 RepID=A0ABY3U8Y8_9MYCO|nr:molybdate ABC transporter substrate-binding protein [Mycolicibacillus parakoreensis]MCV7317538.1 molybdate ABC transporter substrate-binding protein [Mycolicibacillus parakoreensis]ULN54552.1 molybdate ABC transporter substrate-binding protein [Mycolicibacillus parakoreensis]